MTESGNGYTIDVSTFTVLLVGKDLINDIFKNFKEALDKDAMAVYNQIALTIVKISGPKFGIDPENIPEPDRWSLGTINKEDTDFMRSFLSVKQLMRSEVVGYITEKDIRPIKE